MIQLLEHSAIDKQKWNRCIRYAFNSRVYAYSWYLDIVAPEWSALVLQDYKAVMPLFIKHKWGISYCAQPHFTQQLGVFTNLLQTPDLLNAFINKLTEVCQMAQINLNQNNLFKLTHPYITHKLNHEVDLVFSYKHLYQNYSNNNKRNIKKGQKNDIKILKSEKPEALIQLFRDNKGKEIKHWKNDTYHILNRLIYRAIQLKQAKIWSAYTTNNTLCAGAFFIQDTRRHTFLFSGSNDLGKENGAMSFLIDNYIQQHCTKPIILDFEGSNHPNLARFYRGFGAQPIHYPHLFFNDMPWYISWAWRIKNRINEKL